MLSNEIFDDLFHEFKDNFEDNSSDLIFIQKYDVGLQMIRVCIIINSANFDVKAAFDFLNILQKKLEYQIIRVLSM